MAEHEMRGECKEKFVGIATSLTEAKGMGGLTHDEKSRMDGRIGALEIEQGVLRTKLDSIVWISRGVLIAVSLQLIIQLIGLTPRMTGG